MSVASEPESSSTVPGTVFTPRQVRILKIAVIVMGVLLVGGFAFVLAAIVYQASRPAQDASVAGAQAVPGQGGCEHRSAGGLPAPPSAPCRSTATGSRCISMARWSGNRRHRPCHRQGRRPCEAQAALALKQVAISLDPFRAPKL